MSASRPAPPTDPTHRPVFHPTSNADEGDTDEEADDRFRATRRATTAHMDAPTTPTTATNDAITRTATKTGQPMTCGRNAQNAESDA